MEKIYLSQGVYALIDDDDFLRVCKHVWHLHRKKYQSIDEGYAVSIIDGKRVLMHRIIMNAQPGQIIDHINGVCYDNQKHNLRIVTHAQNMRNRRAKRGSFYKGITATPHGTWAAQIKHAGRVYYLGTFATPQEGAKAYDAAAIKMHGEYARLNFPVDDA